MIESVEPENARGPETVALRSEPVPLPTKMPESVVEPVPPLAAPSVPVIVESERQVPPIEKQPAVRLAPFASVDVPEVTLRRVVERPPAKVEVPWPAPTVMAAAKVLVAVVEVAMKLDPMMRLPKMSPATESF